MIDTDNYDYENTQVWVVEGNTVLSVVPPENRIVASNLTIQDAQLIADAPLLLEEVKRLRERVKTEKNLNLWEKAEVKRLREVMIYVEQRQPHPALEWALKEGLTLTEIKEMIE